MDSDLKRLMDLARELGLEALSEGEALIRSPEEYDAARKRQDAEAAKERARAETLWRRLQAEDREAWRNLVLNDPEFQSFALCEKLCHESAELAEDDAGRAFELASLALELAPRVAGDKKLRSGMQEYAWMHFGNALRARGDLKAAEEAFRRAEELLVDSTRGSLPSVVLRDRLAGLEAALLRDQGNLPEALRRITDALISAEYYGASRPAFLLERGRLHRRLGRAKEALEDLSRADRDAQNSDLRVFVRIKLELGNVLCDLGRHGEAKKLLGSLREAAEGFPLERTRLLCLQGRVAAGLDRLKEAETALRKARADLHERAVTDFARLSLELAALYASQGETAKLKSLAERTLQLPGLSSQRPEAAATLKLFFRLAAQDKLSPERAFRFIKDFSLIPAGRPQ